MILNEQISLNFSFKSQSKKNNEPFLVYSKKTGKYLSQVDNDSIKNFLKDQFYFLNFDLLPMYNNNEEEKTQDEFKEFYLFIWCILTNRLEIAKRFWSLGKVWS